MVDAARLLHALEPPAALADAAGGVREANAAFRALGAEARATALSVLSGGAETAEAQGWRAAPVGEGLHLLTAADPRLARRARMLATLSHEIRTPLNGVLGMAGLLASTRLDATQAAYLATLRASGEHLLSLVEEVLDYARLDAGRVELEPAVVDVEHLLQTVCELLSPRAHAAGLEIAWASAGAPPPPVVADDGRLRQVLFNLAGNAVKLTASGGVLLTVSQRPARGAADAPAGRLTLRFSVRDTGPGLDRASQARVWEEFEQADDGVRAGGAGLGLAIVRRLADAFGGRLGVDSRPGEGALFWFEAEFAPASPAQAPSGGRLAGVTVGVASPSPIVAAAAVLQVEGEGGRVLRLDAAAPARDPALAAVDVLLVDGAGGLAPPPPGPPALVLLAPEAREDVAAARTLGYAGWLIKPLRRGSMADRIRTVLGGVEAGPAAAPAAADDERAAPTAAAGLRVLLAEDNAVNALLARAVLQREGCEVTRVATGGEAVDAARRGGFDLVLMDLRMPGLDGLAATAALRAAGVRTPVVALTANAFDDDRRACAEAGLDGFLTKPLDPAALRAVLARWARPRGAAAA